MAEVAQQIKAMIAFINQEAREKAEEIRINAERAARNEQATFIHSEKLRLNKEYERKQNQVEQERARKQTAIEREGQLALLRDREKLTNSLRAAAAAQLQNVASGMSSAYQNFLIQSAVEAALLIDEPKLQLQCTLRDKKFLVTNLSKMQDVFAKVAKDPKYAGKVKKCVFSVNSNQMLAEADSIGGVSVTGFNGKIKVDNSLSQRLDIAMHDMLPVVGSKLFPMIGKNLE